MAELRRKDGQLLVVGGQLAIHDDCCAECDDGECTIEFTEFTDEGFIDGGQAGALREYATPGAVTASPWSIITGGLRIDFEDSFDNGAIGPNCADHNPNRQEATASGTITLSADGYIYIGWEGAVSCPADFEHLTISTRPVDSVGGFSTQLDLDSAGPEFNEDCDPDGCEGPFPPIIRLPTSHTNTYTTPFPVYLEAGEHSILIVADTTDETQHVGNYFEVTFSCFAFDPTDPPDESCTTPECEGGTAPTALFEVEPRTQTDNACQEPGIDEQPEWLCAKQFNNLSTAGTCPIVSYLWDFGDNTTSTEQDPFHIFNPAEERPAIDLGESEDFPEGRSTEFASENCWLVTLTVTDSCGCTSCYREWVCCCDCEEVGHEFTGAAFAHAVDTDAYCPLEWEANLHATAICFPCWNAVCFSVDWGDGNSESGGVDDLDCDLSQNKTFTHTYCECGDYTITFQIVDMNGCVIEQGTITQDISICCPCTCCENLNILGIFVTFSDYDGECTNCDDVFEGTQFVPFTENCGGLDPGVQEVCNPLGNAIQNSTVVSITCTEDELTITVTDGQAHTYRKTVTIGTSLSLMPLPDLEAMTVTELENLPLEATSDPTDCVTLLEGSIPLFDENVGAVCGPGTVSVEFDIACAA